MPRVRRSTLLFLLSLLLPLSAAPFPALGQEAGDDELAERRALAESGAYLLDAAGGASGAATAGRVTAAATAGQLADALDVPPGQVLGSSIGGPAAANAVFAGLGVIQPKQGDTFALLSSGIAGTGAPEPGVDFSPLGTAGDSATLTLNLEAPQGATHLSFDFNFLSAEFPDFVGSAFNDTFTATLTDAGGTRQIGFASVNSSFFFAASASRAGGTGFAIFTENPSGVDTSFGGGLPDAGLTDWQSVKVEIAGGGPLTVVFNVRDLGDGILDSAVILDNLVITSLEALDPNPGLLGGSEVTTDVERLATGGEPVQGAAADGVTRVLLRTTVPSSGQVEFSLVDASAPEDGGLSEVGGTDRLDSLLVPVETTAEGFQAFAVYLVPEEFNRGGDEGEAERPLRFRARFLPDDGEMLEAELPFRLVRPPVVLIHGLWSEAGTWTFPLVGDGRFLSRIADYSGTNARRFIANRDVPFQIAREALTALRNQGIAATQVDVAGHSMGGILSRNHVGLATYRRPGNFDEGDLNKLLTLNTPHTGSPLANFLLFVRDDLPDAVSGFATDKLRQAGMPIDEGAIDDLAKGSFAISVIQQTPVPAHALVGIGGSDLAGDALSLVGGPLGVVFKILDFIDDNTDLFAGIQHDLVVGRESQEGGMPASATTVFDGFHSIHTNVPKSATYSSRVIELFNSPADGGEFAELPPPSTLGLVAEEARVAAAATRLTAAAVVPDGVAITSPASGITVTSGSSVSVTVAAQAGFDLERALVISEVEGLDLPAAPFTGAFPVPLDFVGDLELSALGADGDGNLTSSPPITLHVVAPAALQSVTVLNRDPILFGVGAQRQLYVVGSFADGVLRDVTDPSTGTFFQSAGPGIASVTLGGLVTATGEGITTVVARNGLRQDSVSVTVLADDVTPPTILAVAADPSVLWPPSNKLETVTISVEVVDDQDPQPACAVSGVTADEPAAGDAFVTGPLTVDLRAARLGTGDGRVYAVEVVCTDEAGNSASAVAEVTVPHDQGN
jgi:pimeloyl-ACP methyl ester carboxylesterase